MSPPRCTRSDGPITFCNGGLDHPMTKPDVPERTRSFTRLADPHVRTCPDMPGARPRASHLVGRGGPVGLVGSALRSAEAGGAEQRLEIPHQRWARVDPEPVVDPQ